MPEVNDPALSPKEVAQQLGFCTRTVLKRIHSGEITPAYRINKRVIRIPQSAVTEYLNRCHGAPKNDYRNYPRITQPG